MAFAVFFLSVGAVFCADNPSSSVAPVIALSGTSSELSDREKSSLDRDYRYQVRQKDLLLNPYISGPASGGSLPPDQSEYEKFHRYFGIAMSLYKEGRLEEAVDILRYIVDKNPDDDYAKSYLARMNRELGNRKRSFKIENKIEASRIKRNKVRNLVKDGIAYYNAEDFDRALLKFSDTLALDPGNPKAMRYMDRLKKHYSKDVRVENIAQSWMDNGSANDSPDETVSRKEPDARGRIKETAEKLLDSKKSRYGLLDEKAASLLDSVEKKSGSNIASAAEKLLDSQRMKELLLDKRAASLLNDVELDDRIRQIIGAKISEEKKSAQFTLGPGDTIQINVRDHPELSGGAVVQVSGDINLPLINDNIMVKGLTVDEITEKATEVLKRYVQDPYVAVSISGYKSKMFYVIDENSCTPYPITRAYLTLRDALFMADWGNNRALGRVLVMKPSMRRPIIKKVDAFELVFRSRLENNVRIEDGDVIYIPMTMMAKATKTIYDTLAPFRAVREARNEYLNQKFNEKDWKAFFREPINYVDESQEAQNSSISGNSNLDFLITR